MTQTWLNSYYAHVAVCVTIETFSVILRFCLIAPILCMLSVLSHTTKTILPPLVLKARHPSGSAFCYVRFA